LSVLRAVGGTLRCQLDDLTNNATFALTSTNICFTHATAMAQRSSPRWDVKIDEKDNASAPPVQVG
jgi:hypothetical protein